MSLVAGVSQAVKNPIAVGGHVRAFPLVVAQNPVWDTSASRADLTRNILEREGVAAERIQRVTGHADRELVVNNPMAARNERVEIVLLR